MNETPIPCAILGASGYIGQHFARLLGDHLWFDSPLLVGSQRSEGKRLEEVWQLAEPPPTELASARFVSAPPSELTRRGIRLVFGALPSGTAGRIESELGRRGIPVFSNSADHRMDPRVPLLVPEVNANHLALLGSVPIVTNPNCTATGLVLSLAPILRLLQPEWVSVVTYQAISGAGFPGVPSLSITDNVIPFIQDEEEKVAQESNRILGTLARGRVRSMSIPFLVQCARVAVRDGHLEAVALKARKEPTTNAITQAIQRFDPLANQTLPTAPHPPLQLRSEVDRPQPIRDRWAGTPPKARGMTAVIGRLRWDPPFLRFFVLSHNAVRGGAGGSVLNAELAYQRGFLTRTRRNPRNA